MARKKREEIIDKVYNNPDEHALFYTLLGLCWWFFIVYVLMWICDGCSMFSKPKPLYYDLPEPMYGDSEFYDKVESTCSDDEVFRFIPSPRPVYLPDFENLDEIDTEEYQYKLRQNPPKSTMGDYKII